MRRIFISFKAFVTKVDLNSNYFEISIYTRCRIAEVLSLELLLSQLPVRQPRDVGLVEETMNKTRTHLAVIAMVASLSLLAACSKGEDNKVSDSAGTSSPAVVTPPAPVVPEPAPYVAPAPQVTPAPADNTSAKDTLEDAKQAAKETADKVADKTVELKDQAKDAASRTGDFIKDEAAKADKAIQDKLGNGTASDNPKPPATTPGN